MGTAEMLDTIEKLRAMGATSITFTPDGSVSGVAFAAPLQAVKLPSEVAAKPFRHSHPEETQSDPRVKRAEFRDKIIAMAGE